MPGRLSAWIAVSHGALLAAIVVALAATGELDGATAGVAAGATAAAAAVSIALGQSALRSLGAVTRAAEDMAGGDFSRRVAPGASEEVRPLAEAFDRMAASLSEVVEAATRERNRLIAALNSSADAVVALDAESRVAFANEAAAELFGQPLDELVGQSLTWALPDVEVEEALRVSREDGATETRVIERPNRQYLQLIATPILGSEEGGWSALAVFHDVSDVKRVEQVRRDFVANVSHELRTPLAGIKSVLETLEGGALEDVAAAREFLSRADAEVDRLVKMVEELLELSRLESGEAPLARRPVEMARVLETAVDRLRPRAERQGASLSLTLPAKLPPVTGDADLLERAAINLISNAIKFSDRGGTIRVSARAKNGSVTVSVSDSGVGIAPEDLPRVFERFYKADRSRGESGTGLGLAVVKHTVEAHGGSVDVESREGRGSTFSFSIPTA